MLVGTGPFGTGIVPRLIEYMDVGNRNEWSRDKVVPSAELIAAIDACWPLDALPPRYAGEVASRFRFRDGQGEIGVISSISQPFCGDCSRARLSSNGTLYTCLFATRGADLRAILRDVDVITTQDGSKDGGMAFLKARGYAADGPSGVWRLTRRAHAAQAKRMAREGTP